MSRYAVIAVIASKIKNQEKKVQKQTGRRSANFALVICTNNKQAWLGLCPSLAPPLKIRIYVQ